MAQKTPVSLMNELAKANKMNPDYKVIEESGPAHKRTFKVELTLGDVGIWEGQSTSIKEARHVAATVGLEKCGLCMPEKKPKIQQVNLTPTVELNGLAMKLGKPTQYHDLQPKIPHFQPPVSMGYPSLQMQQLSGQHHNGTQSRSPYHNMPQPGQNHYRPYHHNSYHHRQGPPPVPRICCVKLMVGEQEFTGEGRDKQKARNNAALKAIQVMREELSSLAMAEEKTGDSNHESEEQNPIVRNGKSVESPADDLDGGPDVKSEISQVFEIATKRKLQVNFEDVENSGPAHMKRFVVCATVGDFKTVGAGSKKKDAKQEAAKKMLEELNKLPELPQDDAHFRRTGRVIRRGPRISHNKPKGEIDPSLNPVSILGQILQRRHDPPPSYKLLQEKIMPQGARREFIMQVTVGKHEAKGSGPNKKEAKKKSSEAMLQLIGFRSTDGQPTDATANPQGEKAMNSEQQASFNGTSSNSKPTTILGRQLKPGLLPMVPELVKQTRNDMMNSVVAPIAQVKEEPQEPTLQGGLNRAPGAPVAKSTPGKHLTPVQKLLHLAEVEGFRVQFTDYPKDIKGSREFLTLVTVSSMPPLTCYGSGATVEASREEAASNALKPLLQLGLDRTSTLKSLEESQAIQGVIKTQPSLTSDVKTCDEGRENPTNKD